MAQTKNPRKKAKNKLILKKDKTNILSYGVLNLAVPEHITEPHNLDQIITPFVPSGCNNLFPQYLAELKRQSPTHRAILTQKTAFTSGRGFTANDETLMHWFKLLNA